MSEGYILFGSDLETGIGIVPHAAPDDAEPLPPPIGGNGRGLATSIRSALQPLIYGLWAPGALLAADGSIVVTNEAWERLAERPGGRKLKLGGNYFGFNREEAAKGNADSLAILSALAELGEGRPLYREVDLQGLDGFREGPSKVNLTSLACGDERYIFVNWYSATELDDPAHERQALDDRVLRAQEEERRRIARDLHDSTSQWLVGLQLSFAQLKRTPLNTPFGPILADCETALASIQREIRTLSYLCHPPALGNRDLGSALEAMTRGLAIRAGLMVQIDLEDVGEIAAATEATLYRLTQEALANICRHAQASTIGLRLASTRNYVHLVIEDDGIGFDAARSTGGPGVGIAGMKERVAQMAGRLSIRQLGQGTSLLASLPR